MLLIMTRGSCFFAYTDLEGEVCEAPCRPDDTTAAYPKRSRKDVLVQWHGRVNPRARGVIVKEREFFTTSKKHSPNRVLLPFLCLLARHLLLPLLLLEMPISCLVHIVVFVVARQGGKA